MPPSNLKSDKNLTHLPPLKTGHAPPSSDQHPNHSPCNFNFQHKLEKKNLKIKNKKKIKNTNETKLRTKRDFMMMPGTLWCGDGSRASQISQLGAQSPVDRCCRQHDHCPYTISSQCTEFDLTNYRPVTISHCDCDER